MSEAFFGLSLFWFGRPDLFLVALRREATCVGGPNICRMESCPLLGVHRGPGNILLLFEAIISLGKKIKSKPI